jgi:predicted acetyltransferase
LRLGDYRDIPPGGPWPNAFVREGPDGPDGFVAWTASRDFDIDGSSGALEVADLCAANDAAYRDLWAYLTGIDLVDEITLGRRPVDEPVRWLLTDGRALRQTYAGDGLWLRILDLPAALSARRYAVPDRLTFEVVDDDIGGFASGRYVLDGGPDGASCAPSTVDSADLRVHQRALAGAYLGGFSLRGRSVAGGVDELTPGALRRADAMFATPLAPWCATGF